MRDQLNLRVTKDPKERKEILNRMDERAKEIVETRLRVFGSFGVGDTSGSRRNYKKEGFSGSEKK